MPVNYIRKNEIGVISISNPPVNALSQSVRRGLLEAVIKAQTDDSEALVLICEGTTFIAGADINEFGKPALEPSLPSVCDVIESSNKPIVAAIHGNALGGGLEIALSCHYRYADPSSFMGLPEVKLGLLPGAGGTQRLPRLIGIEAALELISSGNVVSADTAKDLGFIDHLGSGPLLDSAISFIRECVLNTEFRRVRDLCIPSPRLTEQEFDAWRSKLARKMRGQIAPQKIVSCIRAAQESSFEEGLKIERDSFLECLASDQSSALRHVFFSERRSAKVKGMNKNLPLREIQAVGVIGAGTMGVGIAMVFANANIPVTLLELSDESLDRGMKLLSRQYDVGLAKGKLSQAQVSFRKSLISGTTSYSDLVSADLVIEAVFENMGVKQEVFSRLDEVCKPGAILATNTSYLDINEIARFTSRPADVVGLHFFSPANLMKLLEVVRSSSTSQEVIATAMALGKRIGKVPVLANVGYGFIGNRMLRAYAREAQLCMLEGSDPETIDDALVEFGMAMGPLSVGDLAGLDVGYRARQELDDSQKGDSKTFSIADALVELGRLGRKTGKGYYCYDPETQMRTSDPIVLEVIEEQALIHGMKRRSLSQSEIVSRHILALINEGFRIVEEGIAQRFSDIDVVYIHGYGFPAWRGGPMYYAQSLGLENVLSSLRKLALSSGDEFWMPSSLLIKMAESGESVQEWDRRED